MSWDGTLASGGIAKHGTAAHTNQGNPGTYAMPFAVTFDSAGAESAAYQAWSATPTFPANTYVLGSDSKLYKAVVSNAGNDPTTDDGTHWIRVSVPKGGASSGQVPIWDNTAKEYLPGTVSGTVAGGTIVNNTLRWNGSAWVESSYVKNSDSQVTVNSPTSPISGIPLVVKVAGTTSQPNGLMVQDETATDPVAISIFNSALSAQFQLGICGATNDYMPGTSQADGVLRLGKDGKRIWIGSKVNPGDSTGTAIIAMDQTGVVIGSTGAAGAKLDVTGASGQTAAKIASTGGATSLLINSDVSTAIAITNSTAVGTNSGGGLSLSPTGVPSGSPANLGHIFFASPSGTSGAQQTAARISSNALSAHSVGSSPGNLQFYTTPSGSTTVVERMRITDTGDVVLNVSGSQLASNATGPFLQVANLPGLPTGTPASLRTGATPIVYDATGNRIFAYNSGWIDLNTRPGVTLTDGATINTDASLGKHFRVTLAGNRTMAAPTNPSDGQKIVYEIIQDATGSRTLTWNAAFVFGTDVPQPTLTTTASKRDFIGFVYNASTTKWYCLAAARGY